MSDHRFLWGAATSAYQIEGAYGADGKSPSIWDTFSQKRGAVRNGHTGNNAADHRNRYLEDVVLIKELGLDSYRFSISWSRVMNPDLRLNHEGLDFYKRLIEALQQSEITPMVTLFHWDLPQWIQDIGGWASRDSIGYFTQYAQAMFKELGDTVPLWVTHNEPWVYGYLGHLYGDHAPGHKNKKEALQVIHNLLVSHGQTVQLYKEMKLSGNIGIALNMSPIYPVTSSDKDLRAADMQNQFLNRWFLDPLMGKGYPEQLFAEFEKQGVIPEIDPDDLEIMSTPFDFLGINYYMPNRVKRGTMFHDLGVEHVSVSESPKTMLGWEIYPEGLYDLLLDIHRQYPSLPIYITENGAAYEDMVVEGSVFDQSRVEYLQGHISAVTKATEAGCDVRGYYVWSLMDNFEWQHGYDPRFGLIYIDYQTLDRIPKQSFYWYKDFIAGDKTP